MAQKPKRPRWTIHLYIIGGTILLHVYKNVVWTSGFSKQARRAQDALEATTQSSAWAVLPNLSNWPRAIKTKQLCSRQQIISGAWVPTTMSKPPYVSRNKHLRCFPDERYNSTTWHTWEWQPHDYQACHFSDWNALEFCRLTRNAAVSVIGDSLSWEQFSSLAQLLGQRVRQTDQHKSKSENRNHILKACNGQTPLVFRNDPRLEHLTDSIQANFPLILILNRGAHYVNDTMLLEGLERNIVEIQAWQNTCTKMKLKCHLFWRTSVPGHPRCTMAGNNEDQPNNDLSAMEQRVTNRGNYDNLTITYHWYDFQHQNQLILDTLAKSQLVDHHLNDSNHQNNIILDAYYLNILRPDEHRAHDGDCLHNCYPGKMDVYNQLLLHYLKMQRTEQDIQHLEDMLEQARRKTRQIQDKQPDSQSINVRG